MVYGLKLESISLPENTPPFISVLEKTQGRFAHGFYYSDEDVTEVTLSSEPVHRCSDGTLVELRGLQEPHSQRVKIMQNGF